MLSCKKTKENYKYRGNEGANIYQKIAKKTFKIPNSLTFYNMLSWPYQKSIYNKIAKIVKVILHK